MNSIIKAENLTFSYPGDEDSKPVPALKGVSFEIEEGSFTAILGHNGSGKSTLAKLLCMINTPDSGKLWIMGKDMTAQDVTDEDIMNARRDVGMYSRTLTTRSLPPSLKKMWLSAARISVCPLMKYVKELTKRSLTLA